MTGMATSPVRETDLYAPIKLLLEGQGYQVKSEIGAADIVACRDDEEPVIVELKTGFSLSLFHQAIARQGLTDAVYVAVPHGSGRGFARSLKNNTAMCRRLGLGLITVRLKDGAVAVYADPAQYKPRKSRSKQVRLLREFAKRVGDPNKGGAIRQGLMTAYRQDALRCVRVLHERGPIRAMEVAKTSGVEKARRIMADDHYGWFERVRTGIYALSPRGEQAVLTYAPEFQRLAETTKSE